MSTYNTLNYHEQGGASWVIGGSVDITGTIKIDGTALTASAAELNVLDGITASTDELNYCEGGVGAFLAGPAAGRILKGGIASKADGETIDTGLASVDFYALTATAAGHIVSGTVADGIITIGLKSHDGTAVEVAENVVWLAIGVPA